MLIFHTELLERMLDEPAQVLSGEFRCAELELVEETVNEFGVEETIPPIHEIQAEQLREKYYLYSTFCECQQEVAELAEAIQSIPTEELFTYVHQLLGSQRDPCDIYLVPLGYPLGDAYVRPVDGRPAMFFNLTTWLEMGQTTAERMERLLPVMEHEIFHVYFHRRVEASPYWQEYQKDYTPYKQAKLMALDEGIGHFVADRKRIGNLLRENGDHLQVTHQRYLEVMENLAGQELAADETQRLLIKGVANSYLDKYIAMTGMLAIYAIDQLLGIDGVRRCLEDMHYFEEEGLKRVASGTLFTANNG